LGLFRENGRIRSTVRYRPLVRVIVVGPFHVKRALDAPPNWLRFAWDIIRGESRTAILAIHVSMTP
jgi:hypothetical protein